MGKAWAQLLAEKAATGRYGNRSPWGLWAFGPPPEADPESLAACLAMMRDDWNHAPYWDDRKAAEAWRAEHRERLRRDARFTGTVSAWVAEQFDDFRPWAEEQFGHAWESGHAG